APTFQIFLCWKVMQFCARPPPFLVLIQRGLFVHDKLTGPNSPSTIGARPKTPCHAAACSKGGKSFQLRCRDYPFLQKSSSLFFRAHCEFAGTRVFSDHAGSFGRQAAGACGTQGSANLFLPTPRNGVGRKRLAGQQMRTMSPGSLVAKIQSGYV